MTTRKRPDPYAGVKDATAIIRIAEGLLRQWDESRKPWPLMAAFAGAHRARVAVDRMQQEARAAMLARAEAQMRVAREVDPGKAAQAAAAQDAGERLVDAAGRHAPHGTRIAVERLEWQTRMAMLEYAEQQMGGLAIALDAQPERTAVDIREALRRDYAKTRLQQAAWLTDSTRPWPQSHVPNAVHKRIARELGVSVSAVNSARVAWLGEHRPPPGETVETWLPIERDAEERAAEETEGDARPERDATKWAESRRAVRESAEWAADKRLVREVQRLGLEINAAMRAVAWVNAWTAVWVACLAQAPAARRADFDFSRRAGRK